MEQNPINIVSTPEVNIPKYSNAVLFSSLSTGQLIISFAFNEPKNRDEVNAPSSGTLIQRILLDHDHIDKMIIALQGIKEKMKDAKI